MIKTVWLESTRARSVKVGQGSAPHPTHWSLWSSSKWLGSLWHTKSPSCGAGPEQSKGCETGLHPCEVLLPQTLQELGLCLDPRYSFLLAFFLAFQNFPPWNFPYFQFLQWNTIVFQPLSCYSHVKIIQVTQGKVFLAKITLRTFEVILL